MADTTVTPPASDDKAAAPAPSVKDQAVEQVKAATEKGKEAAASLQQAAGQVTQVAGQATQVAGQAGQLLNQAKDLLTSKPKTPQPPVAQDEKVWAALCYIPMVALVAFVIKPKSDYVKLHGKQGLLIFLISFFSVFLYIILPPLGAMLGGLLQFACFVLAIFSIYQAFMGNWWKIPVVGQIANMIPAEIFTNVATKAITGQEAVQSGSGTVEPPAAPTPPPAA